MKYLKLFEDIEEFVEDWEEEEEKSDFVNIFDDFIKTKESHRLMVKIYKEDWGEFIDLADDLGIVWTGPNGKKLNKGKDFLNFSHDYLYLFITRGKKCTYLNGNDEAYLLRLYSKYKYYDYKEKVTKNVIDLQ